MKSNLKILLVYALVSADMLADHIPSNLLSLICVFVAGDQITHVLPLSLPLLFVPSARDWALPARMAFFHDHGGQFCGVGWSAADAWGGLSLSWLAGTPSCHHLPPPDDAVLHLVRERREHLLHFGTHPSLVLMFCWSFKGTFPFILLETLLLLQYVVPSAIHFYMLDCKQPVIKPC